MIDDDYLDDDYLDDPFDNSESQNQVSKPNTKEVVEQPTAVKLNAAKSEASDNDDLNFGGLDDDYGDD